MAISASDLTRLRRMIADPAPGDFSDGELGEIAERYPLISGGYDVHAIAAEVWGLKAAAAAGDSERFTSDGKTFDFGAIQEKALKMRAFYAHQASAAYNPYGAGVMTRGDISDEAQFNPFA